MILFAATNNYLDDVPIEHVREWEEAFHRYMDTNHPQVRQMLAQEKKITDEIDQALRTAIEEVRSTVSFRRAA